MAECTLYLKGVTLRAHDASPEMLHSLNLAVDELARQVKRHRDKLRHRREAHAVAARTRSCGDRSRAPATLTIVLSSGADEPLRRAEPGRRLGGGRLRPNV